MLIPMIKKMTMPYANIVFQNTFSTVTFFNPNHKTLYNKYNGELADSLSKTQSCKVTYQRL